MELSEVYGAYKITLILFALDVLKLNSRSFPVLSQKAV